MKVLQIGQLPKEMGGNYTTGVARVVGELSRYRFGMHEIYLYGTNISNKNANKLHSETCTYLGYKKRPLHVVAHILLHPIFSMKAYRTYRKTDKATPFIHMEFIRDNFARVISSVKPDIIHFHGTALSAMFFANQATKIPILYSPHAMVWVDRDNDVARQQKIIKNTKLVLSFANHYTALNDSVVKRMRLLDVTEQNISIVPNGVDSEKFFYSESQREVIRKKMRVGEGTLVFTTVGLVIDRKGQFSFLKLLQSLGINYQYWIIGHGPDEEAIKQYVVEHSLQEKVKLLGYVDDKEIYKYHSAADFYAHVSSYEAQALSEIEAFTCGLRIIVNEEVADTVIGHPLQDTTNYYILNFNEVDNKGLTLWLRKETGMRVSRTQFNWQVIAERYASVYDNMLLNVK